MAPMWLTQEAFDRLALELETLSTTGRAEIVKRIEMARSEGDLKENGGYHAAKDEQGKIEARIRELTDMLKHAHVGSEPVDASRVASGTIVTAHIHGDEEVLVGFSRGSRRHRPRRLQREQPFGPGDCRTRAGRYRHLHRSERSGNRGRDHRDRAVPRLEVDSGLITLGAQCFEDL